MHFATILAVSASIFTLGCVADPLSFTSWPADIAAGKPVTLTWTGAATNEPVTLTLRKGTSTDLQDVEVITAQGKDGTFTWTPGSNIKEGETYAFQVTQDGQRNYSALLRAGAPVNPPASDTTQTGTGTTTAPTTEATSQTTGTSTSSKPLISSSVSGTPSSTPASMATSSISAEAPFGTSDSDINEKDASATASVQGSASVLRYSVGLAAGAMAVFFYLGL
ncbi:hypothetical protein N7520_005273 [Penicillium odoratum]|uniref:uncharacterized protein n=1 Tax=Penicillium odoratum TaxID=1167516 RepID=UPI0025466D3C|nr:uncharacterized protein N7520_005273 [Penicillium odoratum]KAJ5765714.1 hypothetical protein N7520_005273 [Penicillium odoratum]